MPKGMVTEERLRAACEELERRLGNRENCRAEEFIDAWPELARDPDKALDLIYAEFLARSELGEAPDPEEYFRRFPQWREPLYHQFQIHSLLHAHLPGEGQSVRPRVAEAAPVLIRCPWKTSPENFELVEEIARGSMGVVYKAWQKGVQRLVALKVILTQCLSTPDQVDRFRIEAAAIGRLVHPNIVQIFKVREWEGYPFLVLEYVEGTTLAQHWNGAPQPARPLATLVIAIARAAQYAHERGVVHRDLRPGNVLIGADGTPKIIDFGLAKLELLSEENVTLTGQILGTPSYMAPEQAEGRRQIGPLADVYAFGAMLYEGLTGQPPFRGATILETLREVSTKEPTPPRQLNRETPRDLETICLKALHKIPEQRYASAAELADDLERFLKNEPIRARRVGPAERLWQWCRRNPAIAGLLVALAIAIGAIALLTWKWREEVNAHRQAGQPSRSLERSGPDN